MMRINHKRMCIRLKSVDMLRGMGQILDKTN